MKIIIEFNKIFNPCYPHPVSFGCKADKNGSIEYIVPKGTLIIVGDIFL
jgi:hypothetical protein